MVTSIRGGSTRKLHLYIAEHRKAKNWTVQELADRMDVDRVTVWRWEAGKRRPSEEEKAKLAHRFGLDGPENLYRPPSTRPSIDAMLVGAPDDLHEAVTDFVRKLTRR